MQAVEIKKDIFWIGAVDFNKRNFHGYSRSPRGTTYNAYLVKDEKNVLLDTVDGEYLDVLCARLKSVLEYEKIDYIVVNHTEKDHAGSLASMVARCKPEKIFTSAMGKKFMDAQFDTSGWPVEVVKTGDSISIGRRSIRFVEMRMLHWPDSMASYIPEDKFLVTNDAFGQNIASSERFADQLSADYITRATKEYYYNIVLPFSPFVIKTLDALEEMKLDVDMIAPDHGLILRGKEAVRHVLALYRELAEQKTRRRALVFYDTMWGSTELMARAIASGLAAEDIPYRLMEHRSVHHSDVMTEMADCGAVIVGSPTHNNGIMPGVADVLTYMKGLRPLNRIGAAFGSFGWSGEGAKIVHEWLASMNMEMPVEPLKVPFVPRDEALARCHDMGVAVARALKARAC